MLILIKTNEVGGTPFEIALSSLCNETSVITPISPNDEITPADLGSSGAQNHQRQIWPDGTETDAAFVSHIPAAEVTAFVPKEIRGSDTKVTICREPYDAALS
ncbi:hypothetical protein [Leisingera sp. S232]|uniref:hypothetical protein n=1 Tax=Leisingera sp. S232 TaxID=3415132 RepID=UPI003C7CAE85